MEQKKYVYKILDDGYEISIDGYGLFTIVQKEPNIPYPNLSYEENAKKDIEERINADEEAEKERVTFEQLSKELELTKMAIDEIMMISIGGDM